jgi:shikimate dehydrogenase
MVNLALVGKNIQHSKSQNMYEKLLDKKIIYTLLDYSSEDKIPSLASLMSQFDGVSITAPYKKHFLGELDSTVTEVPAVNAIKLEDGKLIGNNTDYFAVQEILKKYHGLGIKKFYLLGDGAMGEMTKKLLINAGHSFEHFSRKLGNLDQVSPSGTFGEYSELVVNTCGRSFDYPINSFEKFDFWDMNYALEHHKDKFSETSIRYQDGEEQLLLQAKYALSFWNLKSL